MDATCKVQDNIHVFRLVHNMCPGFWVHIITLKVLLYSLIVERKIEGVIYYGIIVIKTKRTI